MHTTTKTTLTVYTNDLEREALRQAAYADTPNRLSLNRHRTRRAGARQLTVIALVARTNQDKTLYNECRDLLALPKGTKLDDTVEIKQSRRASRAQRFGFASNRVIRTEIDEVTIAPSFPLSEDKAARAAEFGHLV